MTVGLCDSAAGRPKPSETVQEIRIGSTADIRHRTSSEIVCRAGTPRLSLEAEFAMRPKANKLERIGVGLTIDQHQIGSDMTVSIPALCPLPRESVISILYGQGLVSNQRFENGAQQVVELRPVLC